MVSQSLQLQAAVSYLRAGAVIAYPTETVWGFGCDPNNRKAVLRLLALKQRPLDKGLILVAANSAQLAPYLAHLDVSLQHKFDRQMVRPTTWLVPGTVAPDWIRGDYQSVALRVSTHQQVAKLCLAFGGPIVSTSANEAGAPTARWPWQLQRYLGRGLDYVMPGTLGLGGQPSIIRDLLTDQIIRG
ncbi:L-threonylcarbamoyladenylate synthase [Oceanicoccus sp. KOV_DT_Chl]|uniref:L-threonylcarbamoyladenylate synthase n=1 Tax=Oceanicoccus sp. KOV_DT_Chl TaxID=1904639 RepID=UPI000C7C0219|nr:Sua5/YciO/YrdC/YwlC family protein [Oceanicoccus sp. KOV_DT_Chl]